MKLSALLIPSNHAQLLLTSLQKNKVKNETFLTNVVQDGSIEETKYNTSGSYIFIITTFFIKISTLFVPLNHPQSLLISLQKI